MRVTLEYFLQWGWAARRASQEISAVEARARHEAAEKYYVRVPQPDGYCVIHVMHNAAVVMFLDALNRYNGVYQFNKELNGRAFLEHIDIWTFDSPEQEKGSFYHSRTLKEGTALCTVAPAGSGTREEFQADVSTEDMRVHWDWFPEFGKYDHLCIFDRSDVGAAPEESQDRTIN
ncbi:MAG: hypothetical protein ACK4M6_07815 [Hyphomonas sp.]